MKEYGIIYNPTSAGGKSKTNIALAYKYFNELSVSYELFQSKRSGHAIELASKLVKKGYKIIGAGGDGTYNEILNGVIKAKAEQPCGFIPMGSGNDIPRAIGILPDIKRACEIIAEGYSR
ncbi:MAG: acylglycerol kinase family protein [Promethearchaeota archaeon]